MKIAVVGSGISGLVCAHLLHRDHQVRVYEAADRVGGHTHTFPARVGRQTHFVDTGFIVFNERTYPHFIRLLDQLGVESRATEMSFSVRRDERDLEYSGGSLSGLFAQPGNLLRPGFLRMLRDVLRFYREAPALLESGDTKQSLGDYLEAGRYSKEFSDLHLLPMCGAIWSSPPASMRAFPALSIVRFLQNHGLLQLRERPQWRVVEGGSFRYLESLCAGYGDRIHTRCPVRSVRRVAGGIRVESAAGSEIYDEVILATHSDQALALRQDASDAERAILSSIRYQPNDVLLHTDESLLPRRPAARAAWNYHVADARSPVGVTYWMNRLQGLEAPVEFCVTLNRSQAVRAERRIARFRYDHPVFDADAVAAQAHRREICGVGGIHYCGAYWGYGFHEDGVASALDVTRRFGKDLAA